MKNLTHAPVNAGAQSDGRIDMDQQSLFNAYVKRTSDVFEDLERKQAELGRRKVELIDERERTTHHRRMDESDEKLKRAKQLLGILMEKGPEHWDSHRSDLDRVIDDLERLLNDSSGQDDSGS